MSDALLAFFGHLLVLVTIGIGLFAMGFGLGSFTGAVIKRQLQWQLSIFEKMSLGLAITLALVSWSGVFGLGPRPVSLVLLTLGVATGLLALLRLLIKARPKPSPAGLWTRSRTSPWIPLAALAIPFVPLLAFGATAWTITANDFSWFLSHVAVWESTSSQDFASRHPDEWGFFAIQRAASEKPVATAGLLLASQLTTGALPTLQTSVILLTVLGTGIALSLTIKNIVGAIQPWMTLFVIALIVGLYPWSRVLNGQWGQILAVWACALSIYWASSVRTNDSSGEVAIRSLISGVFAGLAFGANAELLTLLTPSMCALIVISSRRVVALSLIPRIAFFVVGFLATAWAFFAGAIRVFEGYRSVSLQELVTLRPEILPPTPMGVLGLQTSLDSVSSHQNLILWLFVAVVAALVLSRKDRPLRSRFVLFAAVVVSNVAAVAVVFGISDYATGKLLTALIPLVGIQLVILLVEWKRKINHALWTLPAAAVAVGIATWYTSNMPIVIPRDAMALQSSEFLREIDTLDIDLGNYYENDATVLVVPTAQVRVINSPYGGKTTASGGPSLVRLDSFDTSDSTVIPLNETYGVLMPS